MEKILYPETGASAAARDGGKRLTKEERRALPVYGKGEEIFNAVSHIVGGGLGVVFCIISFIKAAFDPSWNKYLALAVYSFSIIALYTMSALYHFLPKGNAKKVFRIFDHCTIFLLIAGCYTPFCLITFYGEPAGAAVFAAEWVLAILGITFNAVNMHWRAVKVLSNISYLFMGWMIVPLVPQLIGTVSVACFAFLLAGGVAYTVGIIFYALGKKKKYMHSVWHLFVLLGTILQFISILYII